MKVDLDQLVGFEWDDANREKNWHKHHVVFKECEQVFFNLPLLLYPDPAHSQVEKRFQVLGQTNTQRLLFISFTIRNQKIRVISARDQSQKERKIYEKSIQEN